MEPHMVAFLISCLLTAFGLLATISVFIFNLKFKNLRFIKMSSPRVNILLTAGIFTLYISCLLLILPSSEFDVHTQTLVHQFQHWLLAVGFTITFGCMLVKGWRVHRLFQYPRANSLTIKDASLFAAVLGLLSLDLILLISWQLLDPILCSKSELSFQTSAPVLVVCSSEYYSIWVAVLLLYKYIIIAMCCYVGWQIRHITFPALDDSRCLLLNSGVFLMVGSILSAVMHFFPDRKLVLQAAGSISVWSSATAVLAIAFLPKIKMISRSKGSEPWMGSAAKYIQQPISSDVGAELVKLLAENKYLRRKLEETEVLIGHLKNRFSNSVLADTESQQMSSAISSPTSAADAPLGKIFVEIPKWRNICCFKMCNKQDSSSLSIQAQNSSDSTNISVVNNKTKTNSDSHNFVDRLKSNDFHYTEMQFQSHSNAIPEVDALQATPARVQAAPARVQATPARVQATPARVQATPARESCSVPQVEHHNEISDNCQAIPAASDSGKLYMNDLDLLYTIAETYNLGGEPDTLSYISNCLQSKKTWMARRHTHHSSQLFSDTAGMLESDQLYPDSIQPSKTSLKDKSKLKKVSRRQSVAASGNVYITDKGRPLIL